MAPYNLKRIKSEEQMFQKYCSKRKVSELKVNCVLSNPACLEQQMDAGILMKCGEKQGYNFVIDLVTPIF